MSRKTKGINKDVDMTDGGYQFKTKTVPGETLGERRTRYKCEVCRDTGWYGDNGPGLRGNREYHPCDQCPDLRAKAEMEQDVECTSPRWPGDDGTLAKDPHVEMKQNESARFKEALRDVRAKMREIKYYHGITSVDVTARIEEALND